MRPDFGALISRLTSSTTKVAASNIASRMTKILESIDRPMSEIGSKPSWMAEAAQFFFGTLIRTDECGKSSL